MQALRALLLFAAALPLAVPGLAQELECAPPGCVVATLAGFAPPVDAIAQGFPVVWWSGDILHTSTEDAQAKVTRPCFDQWYGQDSDPVSFRFDAAGRLMAREGTLERVCTSAQLAPNAAVLTYNCRLHPWMVGVLVIRV